MFQCLITQRKRPTPPLHWPPPPPLLVRRRSVGRSRVVRARVRCRSRPSSVCHITRTSARMQPPPPPRRRRRRRGHCAVVPMAAAVGLLPPPPAPRRRSAVPLRSFTQDLSVRPTVSVETAMREVEVLGVSPQRRRFGKLNLSPCTDRSRTSEGKKNSFSGLTIGVSLFAEGKCTLLAWRLKKLSIF